MRKGEAKLSQLAGVILLILFFAFSLLYLMIFQSVDDVLRATLSVNQKITEMKCDSIMNSFLSAEYYKGDNDHLFTTSCANLGDDFEVYNLTHCVDIGTIELESPNFMRGDFDYAKTEASILGSWYEMPGVILTPNCEELSKRLVLIMFLESNDVVDYSIYDIDKELDISKVQQINLSRLDMEEMTPGFKLTRENTGDPFELRMEYGGNWLTLEKLMDHFSSGAGGEQVEVLYSDYYIYFYRIKQETLPNLTCSYSYTKEYPEIASGHDTTARGILNEMGFFVEEKDFEYCFETYVGECPIGLYMEKEYYYFSMKMSELNLRIKSFSDMNIMGGISFGPPAIGTGDVKEFCFSPIFAVYQRGDSILKDVREAQAYVGWG